MSTGRRRIASPRTPARGCDEGCDWAKRKMAEIAGQDERNRA
jgi:hypothetical protein